MCIIKIVHVQLYAGENACMRRKTRKCESERECVRE